MAVRIPYCTYIRLMIVCWLVIPYFDGAFYVYKNLIRPFLAIKPRILINWSDEPKESPFVSEQIRAKMETSAREKRPEARKQLLSSDVFFFFKSFM